MTENISPFHSNPSCNRKNSLKAGSSRSAANCFPSGCVPGDCDGRRLHGDDEGDVDDVDVDDDDDDDDGERQIWASRLSICRRPRRILVASLEEM